MQRVVAVFTDEDKLGAYAALSKQHLVGEPVVSDDLGALQKAQPLERQQIGIARARADERDETGW